MRVPWNALAPEPDGQLLLTLLFPEKVTRRATIYRQAVDMPELPVNSIARPGM